MRISVALLSLALAAGCGKSPDSSSSTSSSSSGGSSSRVKHISGGTETRFGGVVFDIPSDWKARASGEDLYLIPADASVSGLEEAYILHTDPAARTIDGPEADQKVAELAGPAATRKTGPDSRKFGDVEGRVWIYTGPAQNGQTAEVRVYALRTSPICALIVIGLPDKLARRDKDIDAILASLSKPSAPAGGSVRPELVGQWIWMTNVNANNGGSQTDTWILFGQDGRYKWHYESVSTNPNGGAWGSEDETGSWSGTDNSVTFKPDRGAEYTQQLVKKNHPKNTGDPMIYLNGKGYVTATQRRPW